MKIALNPYMFRRLPLVEMVRTVADIGYRYGVCPTLLNWPASQPRLGIKPAAA